MLSARWRKMIGDARAERGRLILMMLAIAVSLTAVGAVLGAWAVLLREIGVNYLGTRPAHATLELPAGVDSGVAERVHATGLVSELDSREVVLSRARVGDDWRPLLLFVAPDFDALRVNRFGSERGAWPPPLGTVLLERSAVTMAKTTVGGELEIKTPNGVTRRTAVSGLVHDPGLAPAWQERSVYAYATRETLRWLGESGTLHELRVIFAAEPKNLADAEASAQRLAESLRAQGIAVHELRVPPPRQHPHQRQMVTILLLLLTFAGLSLVLSSVLVATTLSAILARQVREIGVMKTFGARSPALAALYLVVLVVLGAAAFVFSLPPALFGAHAFSGAVSVMLNFELMSMSVPGWVFAVQAAAALIVPIAVALVPILRATRRSVREALDSHGASVSPRSPTWLPTPVRNVLRQPKRFALTVLLLSCGGAIFMTALATSGAWQKNLDKIHETRHYDVEVRLHRGPDARQAEALEGIASVRTLEWWGYAPAAFAHPGRINTVNTYPDRGHGSLVVLGPPPRTRLVSFPLLQGRWLIDGDRDSVVLNHVARAQHRAKVGDQVVISAEGKQRRFRIVGVVEEVGGPATVYVSNRAFVETFGPARVARIATSVTSPSGRTEFVRSVESVLAASGASVELIMPFSELRTAIGDHIVILIRALLALAVTIAIVGILGLSATVSIGVVERTREIGVMKAVGATRARITRLILSEGLITGGTSSLAAMALSIPLTVGVQSLIGRVGFLAPLPFVVSPGAMAGWFLLVAGASVLSTLIPARRAARISVREALAEV